MDYKKLFANYGPGDFQVNMEPSKSFNISDHILPQPLLTQRKQIKQIGQPELASDYNDLQDNIYEDYGVLSNYLAKEESDVQTDSTPTEKNNSDLTRIDIEDLLRQEGITSVNGKLIKFGNKALRSSNASYGVKNSNHKKRDPLTGNAMARDISIIGGNIQDYADLRAILLNNQRVVQWFAAKGWGIINELTPAILRRTNGTVPHFHFGPDSWARRTWAKWLENPDISITQAL